MSHLENLQQQTKNAKTCICGNKIFSSRRYKGHCNKMCWIKYNDKKIYCADCGKETVGQANRKYCNDCVYVKTHHVNNTRK